MRSFVLAFSALGAVLLLAGAAATPVPGGEMDVLTQGRYVCELPGDAGDPGISPGRHIAGSDFEVIGDSSYRAGTQRGLYLLTGDDVVFTSGPLSGRRFHQVSNGFLRALNANGSDADLRCVRSVQTLGLKPDDPNAPRPCHTQAANRPVALGARREAPTC